MFKKITVLSQFSKHELDLEGQRRRILSILRNLGERKLRGSDVAQLYQIKTNVDSFITTQYGVISQMIDALSVGELGKLVEELRNEVFSSADFHTEFEKTAETLLQRIDEYAVVEETRQRLMELVATLGTSLRYNTTRWVVLPVKLRLDETPPGSTVEERRALYPVKVKLEKIIDIASIRSVNNPV